MTKTKKLIAQNISLVDVVIELLDARIPSSGRNPDIDVLCAGKKRIVVLNKADLADEGLNILWKNYYADLGFETLLADSVSGKGLSDAVKAAESLMAEKIAVQKAKGRINVTIRAMIVGIPNVGKSTFINKTAGRSIAKTADKPGVTKTKQWIKVKNGFELMDTPGILWPKFDDEAAGIKLAATGAIRDEILDIYTLSLRLIEIISQIKPEALKERYKIEIVKEDTADVILEKIARKRGFIKKGAEADCERAAITVVDEFRSAKIGRITLEKP
jgi:ribosome biogenesis GTPase A